MERSVTSLPQEHKERVWRALDGLQIEIPSWGFANTGTRFGKFIQPAAATNLQEKFADASEVHRLTGITPTVALHVLWDLPEGEASVGHVKELEQTYGIRSGSINPNLFQDQEYKYGSLCNPDPAVREKAVEHMLTSVRIARELGSRDISLWVSDGSNYPGTQSISRRIGWLEEALKATHAEMAPTQRLLVEYKPFEPAFYHTDIADWGMAYSLAKAAGPQAVVLVDTGHHALGTNIEQIVAWLLHLNILGGFHFNDRKFADDDLTIGSIDPYQVFRIFHEILSYKAANDLHEDQIAYMIDQSHNLKGKMEAMVQTVMQAQELFARAALVDQALQAELQDACKLVEAEEHFRGCFYTDVRPLVAEWRQSRGLPPNPLEALRTSGYVEKITEERAAKNSNTQSSYA
ncbi:TIM barrel protein [Terriglobus tenax]|uniref:TIM barrel protein n=1 Tax=Terriglobus tenax TaxID=1111115 RepID=UPI0021E086A2|nr:TIM barrel protein [Terriglobus tenax]